MQSNFDSLSAGEELQQYHQQQSQQQLSNDERTQMSKSISNQFREGGSALQRNAKTIARAQSFRDAEQNRKREELQRRIEETRKKLQNVS